MLGHKQNLEILTFENLSSFRASSSSSCFLLLLLLLLVVVRRAVED
jgi:hypothetical protein